MSDQLYRAHQPACVVEVENDCVTIADRARLDGQRAAEIDAHIEFQQAPDDEV